MRPLLLAIALLPPVPALAQAGPRATPESVVDASYRAISGATPAQRDFALLRAISTPDVRFVMVSRVPGGGVSEQAYAFGSFVKAFRHVIGKRGFFEHDIWRHRDGLGDVATVLSTYESRWAANAKPFQRGLNTYLLVRGRDGWRIHEIFWQAAGDGAPLAPRYLPRRR